MFYIFDCLVGLGRISNTMLNKKGESASLPYIQFFRFSLPLSSLRFPHLLSFFLSSSLYVCILPYFLSNPLPLSLFLFLSFFCDIHCWIEEASFIAHCLSIFIMNKINLFKCFSGNLFSSELRWEFWMLKQWSIIGINPTWWWCLKIYFNMFHLNYLLNMHMHLDSLC